MILTEFEQQMSKLLIFYRDPAKGANEIYWEALRGTSAATFEKACDVILNTYDKKEFPILPVFHSAIEQANRERSSSIPFPDCRFCRSVGLLLTEDHKGRTVAHPCTCSKGKIYRKSFDKAMATQVKQSKSMRPEFVEPDASQDPY